MEEELVMEIKRKGPKNISQMRVLMGEHLLEKLDNMIFWMQDEWTPARQQRELRARNEIKKRIEKWIVKR